MADKPKNKATDLRCPGCANPVVARERDSTNVYWCEYCCGGWFIVRMSKPLHAGGMASEWDT